MIALKDGRSELYQWDTGRILNVPTECSQVHFSNKIFGRSIDVDVGNGQAIIPDILLQSDKELEVWAFVGTAENGYTKISKKFKVNKRNKPAEYIFTPFEQKTAEDIIAKANEAIDNAEISAKLAAKSAEEAISSKNAAELAQYAAKAAQEAAETAKTGAETAKTGAETAKTGAETAKAEAVTAKTDAEASKTAAEASAQSAATSEGNAMGYATQAASDAERAAAAAQEAENTVASVIASLAEQQKINTNQNYRLDNLEAAAQGFLYREAVDATEAYEKTVPSDVMKWATLDKIGGKTLVWNQLNKAAVSEKEEDGWHSSEDGTGWRVINGTTSIANKYIWLHEEDAVPIQHKILIKFNNIFATNKSAYIFFGGSNSWVNVMNKESVIVVKQYKGAIVIGFPNVGTVFDNLKIFPQVIDLTAMFGSEIADNITTPEEAYALGVPREPMPYSEPTLMNFSNSAVVSSTGQRLDTSAIVEKYFPDGMKSAGTVHDEIDFERMVAIQRVGSADETGLAYTVLDTPIETPITEAFDPTIEVESGGTLTFENDQGADYHVPVPNQETFMIKLPGGASE